MIASSLNVIDILYRLESSDTGTGKVYEHKRMDVETFLPKAREYEFIAT